MNLAWPTRCTLHIHYQILSLVKKICSSLGLYLYCYYCKTEDVLIGDVHKLKSFLQSMKSVNDRQLCRFGILLTSLGQNKPECDRCLDNPKRKCKFCSCSVCGDKKEPDKQLMCDECDSAVHIYCLNPPLSEIPDVDEW